MPTDEQGMLRAVENGIAEAGLRPDGTPKGEGWLGLLKRPDGSISTEISAGYNLDGKETDIPLLVPTLSAEEVRHLLALDPKDPQFFSKLMPPIQQKALAHARARLAAGKSVYATRE